MLRAAVDAIVAGAPVAAVVTRAGEESVVGEVAAGVDQVAAGIAVDVIARNQARETYDALDQAGSTNRLAASCPHMTS